MSKLDDARRQALWDALRRRVCSVCLDARDDRSCGLVGRTCAIDTHIARIHEAVASVESRRMDDYSDAVEREVCASCAQQDSQGDCRLRDESECVLYAYLPLVLEAIEETEETEETEASATTAGE